MRPIGGRGQRSSRHFKQTELKARLDAAGGDVGKAALSILDFDPALKHIGPNVAMRHVTLKNWAFTRMADFVDKYRSTMGDLPSRKAGMEDVVRGLFGEETTPQARALAEGIMAARDFLRGRYNAAGGDMLQRRNWGWVQSHDRRAIAAVSKDEWVQFVKDRLDPARMLDASGEPMTIRRPQRAGRNHV